MSQEMQRGQEWLEQLLKLINLPAKVTITPMETKMTKTEESWLVIDDTTFSSEQIQALIGKEGESLDAMQYLANILLNLKVSSEQQHPWTLELNNYRIQRQAELEALVENAAQTVRSTGQEVMLKSLSSAERRQVHNFLQDVEDLVTESRGQEPARHLIVRQKTVIAD